MWHPAESARVGTRGGVPLFGGDSRASETRALNPETAEKTPSSSPPASPHGVARQTAEAGGDSVSESFGTAKASAKSVESSRRVLALEAELAETREALGSARFEIDALEAELASTRERAAEATAFARASERVGGDGGPRGRARRAGDANRGTLSSARRAEGEAARARACGGGRHARARRGLDALDANPKERGDGAW